MNQHLKSQVLKGFGFRGAIYPLFEKLEAPGLLSEVHKSVFESHVFMKGGYTLYQDSSVIARHAFFDYNTSFCVTSDDAELDFSATYQAEPDNEGLSSLKFTVTQNYDIPVSGVYSIKLA